MALLSTLVKAIAEIEGLEEVQVTWIARHLREAGLISQAGRGRGAAQMTTQDAANLLMGVNASSSAKTAVQAVNDFRNLTATHRREYLDDTLPEPDPATMDRLELALSSGATFGKALEAMIEAYLPDMKAHESLVDTPDVLVSFTRPRHEAVVFIGDFSDPEEPEAYFHIVFESPHRDQEAVKSDRVDETRISGTTLNRVAKAISN